MKIKSKQITDTDRLNYLKLFLIGGGEITKSKNDFSFSFRLTYKDIVGRRCHILGSTLSEVLDNGITQHSFHTEEESEILNKAIKQVEKERK